jgi:hypothetical protein
MNVELILQGISMNSNGSMSMEICDHIGLRYSNKLFEPGSVEIACEIAWPTCVTITLGNKHPDDMVVDQHGSIVNKAIEINSMLINRFPISHELMELQFNCRHTGSSNITHENFWGFNGQVIINFDKPSPMHYMIALKNPFEIKRLDWVKK